VKERKTHDTPIVLLNYGYVCEFQKEKQRKKEKERDSERERQGERE